MQAIGSIVGPSLELYGLPLQSRRASPKFSNSPRAANALSRFLRHEGAAAAVEFAFVSPLVIALLVVSVMTGIIYMARSQLDIATQVGARAVMVGSATSSSQLNSAICGAIGGFFNCGSLMVNLNAYTGNGADLSTMSTSTPSLTYNGAGGVSNVWSVNFGAPHNIMVLQVMYQFPMVGTRLFNFATQANGTDLLVSTAVFINE